MSEYSEVPGNSLRIASIKRADDNLRDGYLIKYTENCLFLRSGSHCVTALVSSAAPTVRFVVRVFAIVYCGGATRPLHRCVTHQAPAAPVLAGCPVSMATLREDKSHHRLRFVLSIHNHHHPASPFGT